MNNPKVSEFYHVMIASMNDMKQSMNLLLHTLETIPLSLSECSSEEIDLTLLHYEISRMQNSIAQLNNLYLLEKGGMSLQLTDAYLLDLVEEKVIAYEVLCNRMSVSMKLSGDNDSSSYFDISLISQVLDIAFVNAIRYTKDAIHISLHQTKNGTTITIDDNGKGYPERALSNFIEVTKLQKLSGLTNQTLGWYYCYLVVNLHKNREEQGFVCLSNNSLLGGSRFEIYLP